MSFFESHIDTLALFLNPIHFANGVANRSATHPDSLVIAARCLRCDKRIVVDVERPRRDWREALAEFFAHDEAHRKSVAPPNLDGTNQ